MLSVIALGISILALAIALGASLRINEMGPPVSDEEIRNAACRQLTQHYQYATLHDGEPLADVPGATAIGEGALAEQRLEWGTPQGGRSRAVLTFRVPPGVVPSHVLVRGDDRYAVAPVATLDSPFPSEEETTMVVSLTISYTGELSGS